MSKTLIETKTIAIQRELQIVKGNQETLKPSAIVEWAAKHKNSALHGCFQWDDTEAARQYRIWQARSLISLHIVTEGGERKTVSLSIDRKMKGGGYRDIDDVVRQPELRRVMLDDALAELQRIREKYKSLKELARVFDEIEKLEMSRVDAA